MNKMLVKQTTELLTLLPEEELSLVNSLVKKLVLAWDPNFTKLTPSEKLAVDKADKEMQKGVFLTDDEVWK